MLAHWLAMGGYARYVWPAYGFAILTLGGLAYASVAGHRRAALRLARLLAAKERGPQ